MRQYRGKTKEGKWVYGWYMEHPFSDAPNEFKSVIVQDERPYFVIPSTVGQQTGLNDKERSRFFSSGKDIYFNDIVKWNGRLWVVVWSITLSSIELQPLDNYKEIEKNPKVKRLFGTCFSIGQARYSEIIGNIHENPELLE